MKILPFMFGIRLCSSPLPAAEGHSLLITHGSRALPLALASGC